MVFFAFSFLLQSCIVKVSSGMVLTQTMLKCWNCGRRKRYLKLCKNEGHF